MVTVCPSPLKSSTTDVSSIRRGKSQNQGQVDRGRPIVSFLQEREGRYSSLVVRGLVWERDRNKIEDRLYFVLLDYLRRPQDIVPVYRGSQPTQERLVKIVRHGWLSPGGSDDLLLSPYWDIEF